MAQANSAKTGLAKSAAAKRAGSMPTKTTATVKPVVRNTTAKSAVKAAVPATEETPAASAKTKMADAGKEKAKKQKLVRDSFTMPEEEYRVLGDVKKACIKAGFEVKKSQLLRVGVALIRQMDLSALKDVLASLPPLKAGRPKREK